MVLFILQFWRREEIAEQEENEFNLMIFLRTGRMLNFKLFNYLYQFFEIKA